MKKPNYVEGIHALLQPDIVSMLTSIHEYKGEQMLFIESKGDTLTQLPEIAKIQSTEASNRIEGIYTSDDRIKKIIEQSKDAYYEALQDSSANRYEGADNYAPFVQYMLGVLVKAHREFSSRVEGLSAKKLSKPERIREIIKGTLGRITKAEIMEQCPDISQVTVQRTLADLLSKGEIIKISGGRYTSYTWNREIEA